jgi:predicted dehydrogenase
VQVEDLKLNEKLIIGMVGAGYAAHLRSYAIREYKSERFEIQGVFDTNFNHSEKFSKELKVRSYSSLEAICAESAINTISVAVPNKYHYEIVQYALTKNKNVICEYPLVIANYDQALDLVALADKNDVFLHVGQTMNYDPDYKIVETFRKDLGKLYLGYKYMCFGGALGSWFEKDGFKGDYRGLGEWYVEHTKKGGWIVSAHYHGIQHFRKIFGEVVAVSAFDSSSDGVAAATVLLKHENGASSTVQWAMPIQGKWFNTLIVSGSNGSIEIDNGKYIIHTDTKQESGKLEGTNTFVEDLKNLLDELDGKADFREESQDMLKNLQVALCAEQSASIGEEIEITG